MQFVQWRVNLLLTTFYYSIFKMSCLPWLEVFTGLPSSIKWSPFFEPTGLSDLVSWRSFAAAFCSPSLPSSQPCVALTVQWRQWVPGMHWKSLHFRTHSSFTRMPFLPCLWVRPLLALEILPKNPFSAQPSPAFSQHSASLWGCLCEGYIAVYVYVCIYLYMYLCK